MLMLTYQNLKIYLPYVNKNLIHIVFIMLSSLSCLICSFWVQYIWHDLNLRRPFVLWRKHWMPFLSIMKSLTMQCREGPKKERRPKDFGTKAMFEVAVPINSLSWSPLYINNNENTQSSSKPILQKSMLNKINISTHTQYF